MFRASLVDAPTPEALRVIPDGALVVDQGRILSAGPIEQAGRWAGAEMVELGGVLVPGLIDPHAHWVQHHVRGHFGGDLMEWLRTNIWPEEENFARSDFAEMHAARFFADALRAGTTAGMAYSSAHVEALWAARRQMRGDWRLGNSLMPIGAPDVLCAASQNDIDAIAALADGIGPAHYVLTPRFALNCGPELMRALGDLSRARGLYVQTHLAESVHELREVREAYPDAEDYTDVYDRAGLIGPLSVLGHCIHLSEREYGVLARRGAAIAHCPSSNEALGSGRMDLAAVRRHRIAFALASDIGAGPSLSMLHVMQRFLAQHRAAGERVTAAEALHRATAAGAAAIGRSDEAGCFAPGYRADFVLLPTDGARRAGLDAGAWLEEVIAGEPRDLEARPLGTWLGGMRVA
jgi:guanine deaminase